MTDDKILGPPGSIFNNSPCQECGFLPADTYPILRFCLTPDQQYWLCSNCNLLYTRNFMIEKISEGTNKMGEYIKKSAEDLNDICKTIDSLQKKIDEKDKKISVLEKIIELKKEWYVKQCKTNITTKEMLSTF